MKQKRFFTGKLIQQVIIMLNLAIALVFLFPTVANADSGPKPSLTIKIKNAPACDYYVDALVPTSWLIDRCQRDFNKDEYDPDMLSLLINYNKDGWQPRLLSSMIQSEPFGVNTRRYVIHYNNIPDYYKVIVVTKDRKIYVSREMHRQSYSETVTFDLATGKVSRLPLAAAYVIQYIITCSFTLLVELLLLILCGLKKEWKTALIVNALTQLLLTVSMGTALVKSGGLMAFLIMFPCEIIILIIEIICYLICMKGYRKGKIVGYTILANFLSFFLGIFTFSFATGLLRLIL